MLVPNIDETFVSKVKTEDDIMYQPVNENNYVDFRELYIDILDGDEKAIDDYIKYIEKIVRKSYEYKYYLFLLKTNFDLKTCKFLKNIDFENSKKVSMEMHHYPLTLYDICFIILLRRMEELNDDNGDVKKYNRVLNPYSIAKEVMINHFEGKVGLVPMSLTPHELYHKGKLFIPLTPEYVFGNYHEFFDQYGVRKLDNYKNKIDFIINKTNEILDGETEMSLEKLTIHKVYLEMQEEKKLEKIEKNIGGEE